jgi:hypothetical protein
VETFGKTLFGIGLGIAALGLLLWLGQSLPWLRLGRLPGDIVVERNGFTFFVPLATMLLLSAALTLVFWLVSALRR